MQPTQDKDTLLEQRVLAVSLELAARSWKVALSDGRREKPSVHSVKAEAPMARVLEVVTLIERTLAKWALAPPTRVVISYEAGQDGFWLQRVLTQRGYEVMVIDPASIPVERKARRAKTDRLDAIRLVGSLRAWLGGERDRMRVVRVPTAAAEDLRRMARERGELVKEAQQHRDRVRKLLRTVGNWDGVGAGFAEQLKGEKICDAAGRPLPAHLRAQLERECERLEQVERQRVALDGELKQELPVPVAREVEQLMLLKAIGEVGARRLVLELFWRDFENRKQLGACVGLVPQPYDSGDSHVDQGISKQGNRRVRALLIEMAWMWLRHQPGSALSRWFVQRTHGGGKRQRRIFIVALARRLVIALWRYLKDGVIPKDALLKA